LVCLQLLLPPFHPLIHSGRMTWMISFTFLVYATQVFLDILLASVLSLPDRMACHGKSSVLRGPVSYTRRLRCLPFHLLLISQHSIPPLFLPEPSIPPSHPSNYRTPLPTQPKPRVCLISKLAWRQLCVGSPHICHNPRPSSSSIGVHCCPFHCLPRWMLPIPVLPQRGAFLSRSVTTRVRR